MEKGNTNKLGNGVDEAQEHISPAYPLLFRLSCHWSLKNSTLPRTN